MLTAIFGYRNFSTTN